MGEAEGREELNPKSGREEKGTQSSGNWKLQEGPHPFLGEQGRGKQWP